MNQQLPDTFPPEPSTGGGDLHLHSTFSDGSFTPTQLVEMAVQAELDFVGLTDHDTVEGVEEFVEAAGAVSVEAVPGVEISCEIKGGRYHVLGYYIDWNRPILRRRLAYYEDVRRQRVEKMVELLERETTHRLTMEDVERHAGNTQLGKPHVAKALVEKGVVSTVRQAFDEYLAEGQLLDGVPKERMGVREAVQLIRESNGVPVLAHPVHYEENLEINPFKAIGIQGLEVYYADHSPDEQRDYFRRARELNLLVTGGSDFHGDVKPEVELGDVRLPGLFLEHLKQRARREGASFRRLRST